MNYYIHVWSPLYFKRVLFSRGHLWFDPGQIATKGFFALIASFCHALEQKKSLPKSDPPKCVFFKMAATKKLSQIEKKTQFWYFYISQRTKKLHWTSKHAHAKFQQNRVIFKRVMARWKCHYFVNFL